MKMNYAYPLPEKFKTDALELFVSALCGKLPPPLRKGNRAIELFSKSMDTNFVIGAIGNGKLLGMLGFRTCDGCPMDASFGSLVSSLGLIDGIYSTIGCYFLDYRPAEDECYVDGIAVSSESRGMGVGTAMIGELEKIAARQNLRKLSLQVVDTNPRAQALYERIGFVASEREDIRPLNVIFKCRFRYAIKMTKEILPAARILPEREAKNGNA